MLTYGGCRARIRRRQQQQEARRAQQQQRRETANDDGRQRDGQRPRCSFAYFTSTNVQILAADDDGRQPRWTAAYVLNLFALTQVQILTQAGTSETLTAACAGAPKDAMRIQFTCFTGTKIQILTQKALVDTSGGVRRGVRKEVRPAGAVDDVRRQYAIVGESSGDTSQFTYFTSTTVRILTQKAV